MHFPIIEKYKGRMDTNMQTEKENLKIVIDKDVT